MGSEMCIRDRAWPVGAVGAVGAVGDVGVGLGVSFQAPTR